MLQFFNEVSHELTRHRVLTEYRAGAITRESICDADYLLATAAAHHGWASKSICPVCESENLRMVYWIYGEQLGKISGSARSLAEIEDFAKTGREFTVHTVEVCPDCRWNHLLTIATAVDR
ncbi:Uncharacterised protein [Corynebacterium kutscheri]|uniref:DUF5318 domain-containing protein n=1 Tax=Corynebacterium kutscheri TaxID=35755 RepID=A0A0F6R211_9CORY|nr:DUF5318 family protein [Corynebacterium kutscheri]AKE42195.1 hypothetical protein UL82_10305 [Corynebacterium kutscheri]VEH05787.1 Uncharacterised protein [Corynebacterium kutscheri]VEH10538.1 Uncharacterised protein [Corynebacterium kutscheri]VEH81679.1 Uncharacterised protein [Corynebacterium kutscheri]